MNASRLPNSPMQVAFQVCPLPNPWETNAVQKKDLKNIPICFAAWKLVRSKTLAISIICAYDRQATSRYTVTQASKKPTQHFVFLPAELTQRVTRTWLGLEALAGSNELDPSGFHGTRQGSKKIRAVKRLTFFLRGISIIFHMVASRSMFI